MLYDLHPFLHKHNGHRQKHVCVSLQFLPIFMFRDIAKFYFSQVNIKEPYFYNGLITYKKNRTQQSEEFMWKSSLNKI